MTASEPTVPKSIAGAPHLNRESRQFAHAGAPAAKTDASAIAGDRLGPVGEA
jgi:hypothetical protein